MTLRQLLTPREFEVAALIHDGYSNPEVGKLLGIEESTVKHFLYGMFDKVGCDNRVELAVRYERENPNEG